MSGIKPRQPVVALGEVPAVALSVSLGDELLFVLQEGDAEGEVVGTCRAVITSDEEAFMQLNLTQRTTVRDDYPYWLTIEVLRGQEEEQ